MSELRRTLIEDAFYPPHDPRKASGEYNRVHRHLVVTLDTPCWVCGIRHSDVVKLPAEQRARVQLETHHAEMEWAAERAFEGDGTMLEKFVTDFKLAIDLDDPTLLRNWLDSEGNMLVLCALHHRGSQTGIHSITYPVWKLQRYEHPDGFQFVRPPS